MEIKYERSEGDVAYVGFKFIKGAAQRRPENFQGPKNDNPDNGKRPNILEKRNFRAAGAQKKKGAPKKTQT